MAIAYQCDRCKKFFKINHEFEVRVLKIENLSISRNEFGNIKQFEICDSCFEEFNDWLNTKKMEAI